MAKPTILIAPAAFKGSLSAGEVATEIADCLGEQWGEAVNLLVCPVADGGDDTLSVLQSVMSNSILKRVAVTGPIASMRVEAAYLWLPEQKMVVIEAAQAHGLKLLGENLAPMQATSFGVGELIRHATAHCQPEQLIVTVGGSASTDGGLGALQALGVRFETHSGQCLESPIHGESLNLVQRIHWPADWPYSGRLLIATDVLNPLLGAEGAAAVFAPQKGASPEQCILLEAGLAHVSHLLTQLQGMDLTTLPGVGAAGGLAYGLRQLPRSSLISGSQWLAGMLGLPEKLRQADLIITGEGRFDSTSLAGKATGMLLALADQKPVLIFCGQAEPGLMFAQGVEIFPLAATPEASAAAMAKPKLALRKQVAVAAPTLQSLLSSGLPKPAW